MLADGEDEGVVDGESGALGLGDVEVVALGVGRGMAEEEFVGRIGARVGDWKGERERVRVVFDRMHKASGTCVDFEGALVFIPGQVRFDGVAFLAVDPFCLGERTCGCTVAAFEEVAVSVAGVGAGDHFRVAFDFRRHGELNVDEFEVFDADEAGVVVDELDAVFEVRWTCAGEGEEGIWGCWGTYVLLSKVRWHMGVANFHWPG